MPFFHIMGITLLAPSIYHQGPLAQLPPGQPVTADLVLSAINQTRPTSAGCASSLLEDLCKEPGGLEALPTLDYVFYGGAPLIRSCGDQIARVTNLQVCIGSTEILNAPSYLAQDRADWEYFEWSASSGIVMEQATEETYELVIKHKFNRQYQTISVTFLTSPSGGQKTCSKNTRPNRPCGVLFEKTVEGHPWVQGALVVGVGKFQAGLIVEPQADYTMLDEKPLVNAIWPVVDKANLECPAHAKVFQSMIPISARTKHFKRAPKGSVMRQSWELMKFVKSENASLSEWVKRWGIANYLFLQ